MLAFTFSYKYFLTWWLKAATMKARVGNYRLFPEEKGREVLTIEGKSDTMPSNHLLPANNFFA